MVENSRIPFDFSHRTYRRYLSEYQNTLQTSIINHKFGNRLLELERQMVDYHSNLKPVHCLTVKNSRDALTLICLGLGLKPGDEVLTSVVNDMEIVQTLLLLGLKPVLVEVKKSTFHLDPFDIPNHITEKTMAIIVSDIMGQIANYPEIHKIISHANLKRSTPISIIEDYRQAFGARRNNLKAGMHGMVSYTSWKFSGIGEAAMCLTSVPELADKLKILRNGGAQIRGYYEDLGLESYPPPLIIELMMILLKYWDHEQSERKHICQFYQEQLEIYQRTWKTSGPWKFLSFLKEDGNEPNWKFFTLRVEERRQEFLAYLKEHEIESSTIMHRPLHMQPLMMRMGYRKGAFPIAEKVCAEMLSLPCDSELEEWEQRTWITTLKKFYK